MISQILISIINFYQKTLSPDHGWLKVIYPNGYCQYYPSCSQYAKDSIAHKGLSGIFPATLRVLKCNPWARGGIDEVSKQN